MGFLLFFYGGVCCVRGYGGGVGPGWLFSVFVWGGLLREWSVVCVKDISVMDTMCPIGFVSIIV